MINNSTFFYEIKKVQWLQRLLNYWTMKNKNVELNIKKWEIYEFDFGININAEFSGRHYGIVIHDSSAKNPLVSVIPIKTKKEKTHAYSDVYLGMIEGIDTQHSSIAVINQINTLDKLRIFDQRVINTTMEKKLKLNAQQIEILTKALKEHFLHLMQK